MKEKIDLSNTRFSADRFYYGIAPRGAYHCKGCPNRQVGCHATCEDYQKQKAIDDARRREEMKHRDPGFSKEREKMIRKKMRDSRRSK